MLIAKCRQESTVICLTVSYQHFKTSISNFKKNQQFFLNISSLVKVIFRILGQSSFHTNHYYEKVWIILLLTYTSISTVNSKDRSISTLFFLLYCLLILLKNLQWFEGLILFFFSNAVILILPSISTTQIYVFFVGLAGQRISGYSDLLPCCFTFFSFFLFDCYTLEKNHHLAGDKTGHPQPLSIFQDMVN